MSFAWLLFDSFACLKPYYVNFRWLLFGCRLVCSFLIARIAYDLLDDAHVLLCWLKLFCWVMKESKTCLLHLCRTDCSVFDLFDSFAF